MLTPVSQEQVQSTAQILLAYLEDARNSTPNNMLEGVLSGKSLMRGLVSGQLVICEHKKETPDTVTSEPELIEPEAAP